MVEKLLSLTSSPTITTTPRSVRHTLDPSIIAPTTTMTTSTLQHTQHTHRHHHHHAHLNFYDELLASTEILFTNKLTLLLLLGPAAIIGDATGLLGEAACFALAGIALIPCAERLSYITEQCALHTNETTGALLNATFGNCPELLISVAALRSGYYRVVQLAMLGSIITNMIFVFGASCFIGGLHWQVQELRIPSGNVNVVMLLVATAGTLFPAALALSTSSSSSSSGRSQQPQQQMSSHEDELSSSSSSQPLLLVDYYYGVPSPEEVAFSRLNAAVMLTLYMCFLIFQLGTHKEEFDDDNDENKNNLQITTPTSPMRYYHGVGQQYRRRARSNLFCLRYMGHAKRIVLQQQQRQQQQSSSADDSSSLEEYNYTNNNPKRLRKNKMRQSDVDMPAFDASFGNSDDYDSNNDGDEEEELLLRKISGEQSKNGSGVAQEEEDGWWCRRRQHYAETTTRVPNSPLSVRNNNTTTVPKMKTSAIEFADGSSNHDDYDGQSHEKHHHHHHHHHHFSAERGGMSSNGSLISMRVGVTWLFIITLCVSAITDILVDTIDGFAHRLNVSEVFTSMVVIPFFSNVAEQVSAFIFAYRNEMDLCIGVTVGSAIQIATFVLPGSVIIGMMMDRSMTLLFRPYETVSLFFGTVMVGAILQGGTTNWLTGAMLVGTYVIFASGVWYHEVEVLTVDAELTMHGYNATRLL